MINKIDAIQKEYPGFSGSIEFWSPMEPDYDVRIAQIKESIEQKIGTTKLQIARSL